MSVKEYIRKSETEIKSEASHYYGPETCSLKWIQAFSIFYEKIIQLSLVMTFSEKTSSVHVVKVAILTMLSKICCSIALPNSVKVNQRPHRCCDREILQMYRLLRTAFSPKVYCKT